MLTGCATCAITIGARSSVQRSAPRRQPPRPPTPGNTVGTATAAPYNMRKRPAQTPHPTAQTPHPKQKRQKESWFQLAENILERLDRSAPGQRGSGTPVLEPESGNIVSIFLMFMEIAKKNPELLNELVATATPSAARRASNSVSTRCQLQPPTRFHVQASVLELTCRWTERSLPTVKKVIEEFAKDGELHGKPTPPMPRGPGGGRHMNDQEFWEGDDLAKQVDNLLAKCNLSSRRRRTMWRSSKSSALTKK